MRVIRSLVVVAVLVAAGIGIGFTFGLLRPRGQQEI